jgi:hypothetical protein
MDRCVKNPQIVKKKRQKSWKIRGDSAARVEGRSPEKSREARGGIDLRRGGGSEIGDSLECAAHKNNINPNHPRNYVYTSYIINNTSKKISSVSRRGSAGAPLAAPRVKRVRRGGGRGQHSAIKGVDGSHLVAELAG